MTWHHPHRLVILLAAVTLIPIGVLAWLTVSMLAQDRDVERQRQHDVLQVHAGRVALEAERRLQELEDSLSHEHGMRLMPSGLVAVSGPSLLFQPESSSPDGHESVFAASDIDEQQGRLDAAAKACRALARSDDAAVVAGALLRLGRISRRTGRENDALDAFARLETLDGTPAAGVPASLIASLARGRLFEETGNRAALAKTGIELAAKLSRGGWAIDRATFDSYAGAAVAWGGPPPDAEELARTQAAVALWRKWRGAELLKTGRTVLGETGSAILAVWTTAAEGPVVKLLTSAELDAWLGQAWSTLPVRVSALRTDGGLLFGTNDAGSISLLPGDTRLPFVLAVAPRQGAAPDSRQRTVFLGGISLACALILAAAFGLYRTTMREVGLARQQADFVSAVSHEFRTPLTSMRHILDLLTNRGVTSDAKRSHYYNLLTEEAERLHRMVETLLSFGRIEAGAYAWELQDLDAVALIERTVADFRGEPNGRGRDIRVEPVDLPAVKADPEALSRAVWNLIDNAAKYSPADTPIVVFTRATDAGIELGVRDRGQGIDPKERERIFHKFVRGADAKAGGARGVGIGLALVKMIASAHHGFVTVESTPGEGSTFTIVLPRAT